MTAFALLKALHISFALLSVCGFTLRGYWALRDNPLRRHKAARVLPHIVDTALLATALAMLWIWRLSPLELPWVMAKIVALLLYIALGMVALRFASTGRTRALAYGGALCVAAYIISVALSHSVWGPFSSLVRLTG